MKKIRLKKVFLIFCGLCIGLLAFYLTNPKEKSIIDINGTYQNQTNSFHSITFDLKEGTYIEYLPNFQNGDTIENKGEFTCDNQEVKILSGKYIGYSVTIEDDILVLSDQSVQIEFKKISDVPIYKELENQ